MTIIFWRACIETEELVFLPPSGNSLNASSDDIFTSCLLQQTWATSVRRGVGARSMMGLHFPGLIQCNICHFRLRVSFLIYKMKVRLDLFSFLWVCQSVCFPQTTDNFINTQERDIMFRQNSDMPWRYPFKMNTCAGMWFSGEVCDWHVQGPWFNPQRLHTHAHTPLHTSQILCTPFSALLSFSFIFSNYAGSDLLSSTLFFLKLRSIPWQRRLCFEWTQSILQCRGRTLQEVYVCLSQYSRVIMWKGRS